MKKLLIFMLLINLLINANGQNADKKWGFGVFGGKTEYNGDLGNGFLQTNQDFNGFGGLSLSRYISKTIDLTLQGTYGSYGYSKDLLHNFKGRKTDGQLLILFKLNNDYVFKADAMLAPYVVIGAGISNLMNYPTSGSKIWEGNDYTYSIGMGLKCNFTDWMALQFQSLYNFTNEDKRDFIVLNKKDGYIAHSVGLVFSFGAPRDSDKDGIADKSDKCPNTPLDVKVDENGCPFDTDKDGIADYLDKCPGIAGISAFQGCPDTDGDGIQDTEDKCPEIKGLAAFQGCPDTDGDGVQDDVDKCPTIKGLVAFNGCPDTDGDGIIDSEDRCPTVKGEKVLQGCPDSDKDGIADIDDKCPFVFGLKENKGCPEVKAAVKETFRKALQGIQFATGKDVILKPSFSILDQIAIIMKENPSYKLQINGHTDNVGDANKNKILSENRALSVKAYLLKKGIEENRMQTAGFGDIMPIADNKTKEGQKQNRRVEFIVEF